MTFGEHLDELRRALIKAVAALAVGFLVGLLFGDRLVDYVQEPLRAALKEHYGRLAVEEYRAHLARGIAQGAPAPVDIEAEAALYAEEGLVAEERYIDLREILEAIQDQLPDQLRTEAQTRTETSAESSPVVRREGLIALRVYHDLDRDERLNIIGLSIQEPFMVYMKAALVLGIVLSSPFVFYFIWQFVGAGLYAHERKYVHIFLPFSIILFLLGAALAFFAVFKYVLGFLLWFYQIMGIDPDPRITDWLSFVLILPLGFGISFQLPLVMLFLERIGVFSVAAYLSHWKISVLVICFISMILTPSDPQSMLLMGIPLVFLYFFGVLLCKLFPRRTTPFGEEID